MKKPFLQYELPVFGLKIGTQHFQFELEDDFFGQFENTLVQHGKDFQVALEFDKRHDILVLKFDFSGKVKVDCDRCLAEIWLPIEGSEQLIIKYSAEEKDEDGEVVFITPETHELNVAKFIYEYICLSLPLVNVYDCQKEGEKAPCDSKMLAYIAQQNYDSEENQDAPPPDDSVWRELKKWNEN